jgi:hypothetical protein
VRPDRAPAFQGRQVVLTVGVLDVGEQLRLLAHEERAPTQQVAGLTQGPRNGSWDGWLRVRQSSDGKTVFEEQFPREMVGTIHHDVAHQRWIVAHHPIIRPAEEVAPSAYFSVWEWPFRNRVYSVLPHRVEHLNSSALSPDAARLAVVHGKPAVSLEVFELPNIEPVGRIPITFAGTTCAICWSPDGQLLGSVQDKRIAIYRVPDLSCAAEFALPYPSDLAFCPRSSLVVLGDWQQGLVVPFAF